MNDKVFYERTTERHHRVAVENLARSLHHSQEGVAALYGVVLRHYGKNARIKYFLSTLVVKRVKELLRDNTPPSDIDGRRSRRSEL
jgi:hypothetical protein